MAQYKTIAFAEFDQRVQAYVLPPDFDRASVSQEVAGIANGWAGQGTIRLVYDEVTNVLTEVQHVLPQGGNYQWVWQTGWTPQQVLEQPPPPPPDEHEADEAQDEQAPPASGWTSASPSAGRTPHVQIGVRGLVDDDDESEEAQDEDPGSRQPTGEPQTPWDEWVQLPGSFDEMWTSWQGWPQFREYASASGYANEIAFLETVFAYDQSPSPSAAAEVLGRFLLPGSSQRISLADVLSTDYQEATQFEAGLFTEAEQACRAQVAQLWDVFVIAYQAHHGQ